MTIYILLTGCTGHGKSTLGNLLINPEALRYYQDGQPEDFPTGNTGSVVTTEVKLSTNIMVDGIDDSIRIVDTPGLLESANADIRNVSKILKELENIKVNAIFYVYKDRTTAPFQELTTFYKRLFPKEVLEKNLVLVRTNTPEGGRHLSADKRRKSNIQESEHVKTIMDLSTPPIISSIDSTPYENDDSAWNSTYEKRLSLLLTASRLTPIDTKGLKVPKLQVMIDRDTKYADDITREISRKSELKETTDSEAEPLLGRIQDLQKNHTCELEKIQQYKTQLAIYDTEEPVNINYNTKEAVRGLGVSLTITTRNRDNIPIICDRRGYYLEPFTRHRGDKVRLTSITQSSVSVEMIPESIIGETGGTLYARAFKKDKYASDVSKYKELLSNSQEHLSYFQRQIDKAVHESKALQKHYTNKLNREIANLEAQRAKLLDTYIDFDELVNDRYVNQYAA